MRRHVVVIGAGAAGTMVAHRLRRRLDPAAWALTVIATGAVPRPDLVPGMTGTQWHRSVFDASSLEGASALRESLPTLRQGRLVVHLAELPVTAPGTALELTLLADAWLRERGLRDGVELVHASPLPEPA